MLAACGELEILACLDWVSLAFIADNAFAVKSKNQSFAGSGVLGKPRITNFIFSL